MQQHQKFQRDIDAMGHDFRHREAQIEEQWSQKASKYK